ncbi:MAG: hypothetical protein ACOY0T_15080 [Myxococcota bacterium]
MWKESAPDDQVLNELCDADSLWGPLVFLRPAREKLFTTGRLLLVCSLFGIFYGMCANAVLVLTHRMGGRAVPPVYAVPLFLTLTSFICGELTFLRAWNRRAKLLARKREWEESKSAPIREPLTRRMDSNPPEGSAS